METIHEDSHVFHPQPPGLGSISPRLLGATALPTDSGPALRGPLPVLGAVHPESQGAAGGTAHSTGTGGSASPTSGLPPPYLYPTQGSAAYTGCTPSGYHYLSGPTAHQGLSRWPRPRSLPEGEVPRTARSSPGGPRSRWRLTAYPER